jgi:hypothetical protein
VKLFQIEEPGDNPPDPALPGAAIGVDASGAAVEAAFSVGGNAVVLNDRDEFVRILPVPAVHAPAAEWRTLFEGVRLRAERMLARPVTHAVVMLGAPPSPGVAAVVRTAAAEIGIEILRLASATELPAGDAPALAAALLAEDLMPRPGTQTSTASYAS